MENEETTRRRNWSRYVTYGNILPRLFVAPMVIAKPLTKLPRLYVSPTTMAVSKHRTVSRVVERNGLRLRYCIVDKGPGISGSTGKKIS